LENLIKYLYYLSVFCFVLPSGDLLGVPIKLMVALGLLGLWVFWSLKENKPIVIDNIVVSFVVVIMALMLWACIGFSNDYDTVFMALKSFFSLIITVLTSYILIRNKVISIKGVIKVLYITAIFMVLFKIVCEIALVTGILEWQVFMDLYATITGTSVTTMQMLYGNMFVYRIMAANDFLPLVLMGFYLLYEKTHAIKKFLVILVLGIYTFIVYSRVAMLQYIVIVMFFVASLIWDLVRKSTRKRVLTFILLALCMISILSVVFIQESESIVSSIETFANSMYQRWFGASAEYSDNFRVEQKEYLWDAIRQTPILGQGLGSYVRDYLRSVEVPFSYEAEYLSFLYQFGFVGFPIIIGGLIYTFLKICFPKTKHIRMKLLVLLNFVIWALRPLYNPQFLSSSSGMIIVVIFLAATYYSLNSMEERKRVREYEK